MLLILKYWKAGLIVTLLAGLFLMWRARENALVAKGAAEERSRVADSILAVVGPQRLAAETLLVRDTLRVRQTVERVVSLRDTLLQRITDTVVVREYIARTDSVVAACSELTRNCTAFRLHANQTIAALESKLAAAPVAQRRSCTVPTIVGAVLGAAGGYAAASIGQP